MIQHLYRSKHISENTQFMSATTLCHAKPSAIFTECSMALYIVSRIIFKISIHLNKISYNLTYSYTK